MKVEKKRRGLYSPKEVERLPKWEIKVQSPILSYCDVVIELSLVLSGVRDLVNECRLG
jgi:hypothetical protein